MFPTLFHKYTISHNLFYRSYEQKSGNFLVSMLDIFGLHFAPELESEQESVI